MSNVYEHGEGSYGMDYMNTDLIKNMRRRKKSISNLDN
jgi:hypothetical protein